MRVIRGEAIATKPFFSAGFTLLELLVVLSIMILLSTVALGNYPGFSHRLSVQNLAQQIALEVRQAQVYGISIKEATAGSGTFPAYGVYFSAANNASFILYKDVNQNKKYDFSGTICSDPSNTECIEEAKITTGDTIKDICAIPSGGAQRCASSAGIDVLNITFIRPDPDATIIGTASGADTAYQSAAISIETPKKDFLKTIVVQNTGQIAIQ